MRYRVMYDITTTTWQAFGRRVEVRAESPRHAEALVERAIYADKVAILAARHDEAGEGFHVAIVKVQPLALAEGERGGA